MAEETKNLKTADSPELDKAKEKEKAKNGKDKNEKPGDKSGKPVKEKVKLSVRFKKFIRDYRSEIKKIVWPTKDQVIKNTGVVVFVIIVVAAFVGVLDLLFGLGIKALANI